MTLISVLMNECNWQVSGLPLFRDTVAHLNPVEKLLRPPNVVLLASDERYCPGVAWILFIFERKNSVIGIGVLPRCNALLLPFFITIPGFFSLRDDVIFPLANAHFHHAEV